MYKTVYDLNREELNELKDSMFWADDTDEEILNGINYYWEIPDEVIYNHYNGISFVDALDISYYLITLKEEIEKEKGK